MQSAIGELEQIAALGWRAPEEARLGGWLLRAAGGFTGRANSALVIGDPGRPVGEAVSEVRRWYQARTLPPMIAISRPLHGQDQHGVDTFLEGLGWGVRSGPAIVMTARAAEVVRPGLQRVGRVAGEAELASEPDDAWLSLFNYRGRPAPIVRQLLLSAPAQVFATIRDGGVPVAIGRLALACGWGGLTAIEVRADHRRRGLGTAITATLTAAAAARGVTRMYLQVEEGNAGARALYARCGFSDHHRYHFRVES